MARNVDRYPAAELRYNITRLFYPDFENIGAEVVAQADGHVFHQTSADAEAVNSLIYRQVKI